MAGDLEKPLLDPENFNRDGIDLVSCVMNSLLLHILDFTFSSTNQTLNSNLTGTFTIE